MMVSGMPKSWHNAQMVAARAEPSKVSVISVTPMADIRQPTMPMLCELPGGAACGLMIS